MLELINLPPMPAPGQDIKPEFWKQFYIAMKSVYDALHAMDEANTKQADRSKKIDHQLQEVAENADGGSGHVVPPEIRIDPFVFPVKTGGSSSSSDLSKLTEQKLVGGTVGDFTDSHRNSDSTDYTAKEVNNWQNVPSGRYVMCVHVVDPTTQASSYLYFLSIPPPPLQDGTTDYALTYDKSTYDFAWLEIDDCAE